MFSPTLLKPKFFPRKPPPGFTLLEVILAITILSTLSVLSTQALSRALKARTKIQAEVDDVSSLRDSMRMIRTDINLAYHHRDFEQEIFEMIYKKPAGTQSQAQFQGQTPGANQPAPAAAAAAGLTRPPRQTKRYSPTTNFVGTEDSLNFITMNNGRIMANAQQADFVEVGYSVKDCKNLTTEKTSKCLFRRVQPVIDEDVKAGGNEFVMLENITEFKLRYFGEGKQDWIKDWSSLPTAPDGQTKGKFPDTVEVSLTIERTLDNKPKTYSMQFVVPIHFPNNPEKAAAGSTTAQPDGSGDQPSNPSGTFE